jgi:hypothetical protein
MQRITALSIMLLLTLSVAATDAVANPRETAVTLWWVVFNNPELCASETNVAGTSCGIDDLFNPDVEGAVLYATGGVTAKDGRITLVGSLYETPEGFASSADVDPFGLGNGLKDALAAEVHLVVRNHGEAIDALVDRQISAFLDEGCEDLGGPNKCEDKQFSIHAPYADSTMDVYGFDGQQVPKTSATLVRSDNAVKVIVRTRLLPEPNSPKGH